jgi:hypothetical protein
MSLGHRAKTYDQLAKRVYPATADQAEPSNPHRPGTCDRHPAGSFPGGFRTPAPVHPAASVMAGVRNPCMGRCLSSKFLHGLISLFDQAGDHLLVRRPDPYWPSLFAAAGYVGWSNCPALWPTGDKSEGSSPSGAEIAPRPCIRSIRGDRNHDAVMRIGGEAPGRRAHSSQRLGSHGLSSGHHHLGSSSAAPRMGRQGGYPVVLNRCTRS